VIVDEFDFFTAPDKTEGCSDGEEEDCDWPDPRDTPRATVDEDDVDSLRELVCREWLGPEDAPTIGSTNVAVISRCGTACRVAPH